MTRLSRWVLLVAVLSAAPTLAQSQRNLAPTAHIEGAEPQGRPSWSVISAETVGAGATVLHFQVGFPGIGATILGGMTERFDFGGKFMFLYGSEASTAVVPGLRLQGILRWLVAERGRVRFGIELEPGLYTYFFRFGGASFGLVVPIKFTIGIPIIRELSLHAGVDIPLMFNFVPLFGAAIPILLGGGVEYLVTPDLSLNFRMRFGPSIGVTQAGSGVTLGLDVTLGVALRL